ncbi:MAG: hypothetical protein QNJ00_06400 [Woeseiaceae bacterium]|nr:hypothetical protein [Woeseiaceae bacterium]
MANNFSITFEGDHVKVISDGDKDLEYSTRLWTAVAATCDQNDCYRVLGIADTTSPLSIVEGYDHAELFRELGIVQNYRIAWVELNEEARSAPKFIETVLVNRGLPGRLFDSVIEAREWLMSDTD